MTEKSYKSYPLFFIVIGMKGKPTWELRAKFGNV